ncbi:21660_t:CDS:2 [Rhizophagus irregularis]|nr:21660_t:CDS:2 [Rhizophagus irregularis]
MPMVGAPIESLPAERVCLRALLAKYDAEDIYNADETGILPTYDDDNDDDVDENDLESDLDDEDIEDYFDNLPNSDDIIKYFQMLDHEIPTEKNLTDEEIVNLAVSGLKIFINYFEQQDNSEFNIDDLRVFRKYLRIARTQEFNSKRQSTLDMFFKK